MKKIVVGVLLLTALFLTACQNEISQKEGAKIKPTTEKTAVNQTSKEPVSEEIMIAGQAYQLEYYQNDTVTALKNLFPLNLEMEDLNQNEKFYNLPVALPTDAKSIHRISRGDVMLYGNDCLVLFYESFASGYSYTPIAKIKNPAGLQALRSSKQVSVILH